MGQLEEIWSNGTAEVHQIVVGPMDNNVYVLRCRRTGDAMLIDAANEHEALLDICRRLGVRSVVETHGHWDHIQAVPAVRDAGILRSGHQRRRQRCCPATLPHLGRRADALGGAICGVRALGHAGAHPGAPSASPSRGPNLLFTGDTLFPGGPSATWFEGGDFATIIESIDRRIFARFDPDTLVLPGHGTATTVGSESPHLQEWVDRGW